MESSANTTFAAPIASTTMIIGVNIRRPSTLLTSREPSYASLVGSTVRISRTVRLSWKSGSEPSRCTASFAAV